MKRVAKNHILDNDQEQLFENLIYWSIEEVAQRLAVRIKTLRDWVYKRQIPFIKIGNLVRFNPSEIQKWIEERNH